MIKADRGHTEFHGSGETILAEYLAITRGIIEVHERKLGNALEARITTLNLVGGFIASLEDNDPLHRTIDMSEFAKQFGGDDNGKV